MKWVVTLLLMCVAGAAVRGAAPPGAAPGAAGAVDAVAEPPKPERDTVAGGTKTHRETVSVRAAGAEAGAGGACAGAAGEERCGEVVMGVAAATNSGAQPANVQPHTLKDSQSASLPQTKSGEVKSSDGEPKEKPTQDGGKIEEIDHADIKPHSIIHEGKKSDVKPAKSKPLETKAQEVKPQVIKEQEITKQQIKDVEQNNVKPPQGKPAEATSVDGKSADVITPKTVDVKRSSEKPVDGNVPLENTREVKRAEGNLADADEGEPPVAKPTEKKTAEMKPADVKPVEVESAEKKPDEVKPVEKKPDEVKPNDVKPTGVKQSNVKSATVNPGEKISADMKITEVKPTMVKSDGKAAVVKLSEAKPSDIKPTEVKPPQVKPAQTEPSEVKPPDVKPAEVRPSDVKPAETKPSEVKPPGVKPAEVKPSEAKPPDVKPAEVKPSEVKPSGVKPVEVKSSDVKPSEVKPPDVKPAEMKPSEVKSSEVKPPDVKPVEVKPPDVKPVEVKPPESKPSDVKPVEGKPSEARPGSAAWPGRAERPARVLALMPYNARSHFTAFAPLLRALAARGHRVDVVSHFPAERAPPGYKDLAVNGSFPSWEDAVDLDLVVDLNPVTDAIFLWQESLEVCASVLEHPAVQGLLRSTEKYDLVLNEVFAAECLAGFAHKFNTPVVGLVSSVAPPAALDRVGNPEHPAYVSNYFLPFVPPLSFWQRAVNALYGAAFRRLKALLCDRPADALARRYFGESLPSSEELAAQTSLVLVNSHPAVNQARPFVPAVVEVGGMHIGDPRPLPQELEHLVSGAEHGVVVVSLGTMVRLASFPAERLAALWAALGRLPQLVIVKSKEALPGNPPSNVRALPWLPQFDLLSHPKTRLLVWHGGLLGAQEAVAAGVPMLGVPLFADQRLNVNALVAKGAALILEHIELTEGRLSGALDALLNDNRYRESARALQHQFTDRPLAPLHAAVWWTEHVLRHPGASHLRCAAAGMPTHRLLLLDVLAALALAGAVVVAATWVTLAAVYRAIRFASARPKARLPTVDGEGRAKRYSKTKQH